MTFRVSRSFFVGNKLRLVFSDRLAHVISTITTPVLVVLPAFLVIALHTSSDVPRALLWWLVTSLGISVAPLLFVYQGIRKGTYSDRYLSLREQRIVPLIFGLVCTALTLVILLFLHCSHELLVTVASVLVAGVITLTITTRWKISLHVVAITGIVTVFTLLFSPLLSVLAPLVFLVAWARWKVHAHTIAQILAGMALPVFITATIFWLLGVH